MQDSNPQQPQQGQQGQQWQQPQQPQQPPYQQQQPPYQQPPYQQPVQNVYVQAPQSNPLGTAGFVLAICGLVFCWVPILNIILWLGGLILSLVALGRQPRGLAIAGVVISGLILLVGLFAVLVWGAALAALV